MTHLISKGSLFMYSDLWDHRDNKLSKALLQLLQEKSEKNYIYANERARKLSILTGRTIRIEKLRIWIFISEYFY